LHPRFASARERHHRGKEWVVFGAQVVALARWRSPARRVATLSA
jgi:hypothetical protein